MRRLTVLLIFLLPVSSFANTLLPEPKDVGFSRIMTDKPSHGILLSVLSLHSHKWAFSPPETEMPPSWASARPSMVAAEIAQKMPITNLKIDAPRVDWTKEVRKAYTPRSKPGPSRDPVKVPVPTSLASLSMALALILAMAARRSVTRLVTPYFRSFSGRKASRYLAIH